MEAEIGARQPGPSAALEVRHSDPRVRGWIARFADGGVGELCGLWCSPGRGFGLASG